MRVTMLLTVISMALFSCTNEAVKEKRTETPVVQEAPKETVSNFTFATEQDTTRNGESITRYKNGVIQMQGMMKNGERDGVWKSWYEDGKQWSETTFREGVKNGKTITWFPNGEKRYEGEYTNDSESGKWIYFDESGKKVMEKDFGKE